MLDELFFVLIELERIFDAAVSFNASRRGKARVDARRLRVVFDLVETAWMHRCTGPGSQKS